MNGSDSPEMWKVYAPRNGVAIQSTVRRLGSSLQESSTPVTIRPVHYFPPEDEEKYIDEALYGSFFIKHEATFGHEKELRELAFRASDASGVYIPVNLELLIERLVLSPDLDGWAVPFITEAVRHFGFGGPIEKSTQASTARSAGAGPPSCAVKCVPPQGAPPAPASVQDKPR